jgi:2Fe-2S ferredoxin
MATIKYVQPDGTSQEVPAPMGYSVMRVAFLEGIDGIVAECGGNAMCATCHVYVDPLDAEMLPPIRPDEDDMLQCTAAERRPNSRLSFQISITDSMETLTVGIPVEQ